MSHEAGRYTQRERRLSLLTAIRRHRGITREFAHHDIPAYADYDTHAAFQRAFERDIRALRQAGYPILAERGDHLGPAHVYRIDEAAAIIAPLSALDVGLVKSVLSDLGKGPGVIGAAHTGLAKLLASSASDSRTPRFVRASIPMGDVTPLARAMHYRQRVRFLYRGSAPEPTAYVLEPSQLAEHFDAFYVSGPARRDATAGPGKTSSGGTGRGEASGADDASGADEAGTWEHRTFRVSRIVAESLTHAGTAEHAPAPGEQRTDDVFTAPRAVLAIRPGCAAPLLARSQPCDDPPPSGAPAGWHCVQLSPVNRQRLAEDLNLYGTDVKLLGEPVLVEEWNERLRHLANLGGGQ